MPLTCSLSNSFSCVFYTEQAAVESTIKSIGWSQCDIQFSRGKKCATGTVHYAIKTDFHINLEMPRIISREDKLHGIICYLFLLWHKNKIVQNFYCCQNSIVELGL